MKYSLTKEQLKVCSSDKQCIIVRGDRRAGKSYAGYFLCLKILGSEENKHAIFIAPTCRQAINIIIDFEILLGHNPEYIYRVDKIHRRIELTNGSRITILTPSDIIDYEFRGILKPDIIVIDDLEVYSKRESKHLFHIIKENYFLRTWDCRFYISYYPLYPNENEDKCEALFRLAGNNKRWDRITMNRRDFSK